ncbi:MAG: S9 family peptidase [Parasphingorhabdus sp.]|uniref:S9 family peptidase n=1 Tax=Parasphingorhabdus sp. TaxID=2709688 RepID=UPI00329960D5
MKNLSKTSTVALVLTGALFSTSIASARPMTAQDLATLKRLGSVAVSSDEKWAAFDVTQTDPDSYKRSTGLYLLNLSKPNAPPLRIADKPDSSEHSPSFSIDGTKLYYLSDSSGSEQLWQTKIAKEGSVGEASQVSDLKADIAGFKLSPNGDRVAIWGDISKDCPTFGCDKEEEGNSNQSLPGPGTGREYDALFVRHWSSWETSGIYSRIFSFDLNGDKLSDNGKPLDGDLIGDSPSKPFGGGEEISWSPSGTGLAFVLRKADRNEPKSTDTDIYGVSVATGAPSPMPGNGKATDTLPAFSPDDRWLAWAAMERPGYESDRKVVKLLRRGDEEPKVITGDWDRSVSSITWTPDSKALIVTASEILDYAAFRVDIADGNVTRLTKNGSVGNITPLQDGSMIFTKKSLHAPNDIYRRAVNGTVTQLTNVNGDALAEIDEVTVERFNFKGAKGDQVWGQIIKPAGAQGKLPMAFLVHGGPQGSFGDSWSTRWNPKVMAAQGYAVVTIDFHGSAGYGQEFMDSINQDWGGKPLEDLKLGHAAALKLDRQIDGTRSCALGASYGGYMMNWIAGQWPDQFDCIINHAGIFDLRSFAFSTEELWFDQWDHGGPWWERVDPEKWNPIQHIDKWKTPTLFIHGEKDFRIPYTQSLMPFTYAQERNIPSKLLIFPDENHWILKGKNSVQWHDTVFDWMGRWTEKGKTE